MQHLAYATFNSRRRWYGGCNTKAPPYPCRVDTSHGFESHAFTIQKAKSRFNTHFTCRALLELLYKKRSVQTQEDFIYKHSLKPMSDSRSLVFAQSSQHSDGLIALVGPPKQVPGQTTDIARKRSLTLDDLDWLSALSESPDDLEMSASGQPLVSWLMTLKVAGVCVTLPVQIPKHFSDIVVESLPLSHYFQTIPVVPTESKSQSRTWEDVLGQVNPSGLDSTLLGDAKTSSLSQCQTQLLSPFGSMDTEDSESYLSTTSTEIETPDWLSAEDSCSDC